MQGLQGTYWNVPISDREAGALIRQYPNERQASLTDTDQATAQTVQFMSELVKHSVNDPVVARALQDAWTWFHGFVNDDVPSCCWLYAKCNVKFVHHQELLRDWMFKLRDLQLLISPEALLKMRWPKGDCAIFTTLVQAMLKLAGYGYETVTVAVNPAIPEVFSHVYAQAVYPDGTRKVLDASHGHWPGWEVLAARVLKKKYGTQTATKFTLLAAVN